MATVHEALAQLRTILLTATAAGQSPLTAGYVYPNDYAAMPSPLALPCIVVSERVNSLNSWDRKPHGRRVAAQFASAGASGRLRGAAGPAARLTNPDPERARAGPGF
jgi:hypothetical protein